MGIRSRLQPGQLTTRLAWVLEVLRASLRLDVAL